MKKNMAYIKSVMLFVCSFIMIMVVEITFTKQNAENSIIPKRYELISDKTNQNPHIPAEKKAVRPVQPTTQKVTEKTTQKTTQKTTEKATQKAAKKSTQKTAEKATVIPTQVPTEIPTEWDIDNETQLFDTENGYYEYATEEFVIATDPPTEWSQELQDKYNEQYDRGYLIAIDNPDYAYSTGQVLLCEADKKLACQIVMGEAGGESFEDCCVVAQCLKDSMVFLRYNSIAEVQKECRYDGFKKEYSQTAQAAVEYIFDQNRSAIAHRVLFFYAADLCQSEWHETQYHVLTRRYARYFDMW